MRIPFLHFFRIYLFPSPAVENFHFINVVAKLDRPSFFCLVSCTISNLGSVVGFLLSVFPSSQSVRIEASLDEELFSLSDSIPKKNNFVSSILASARVVRSAVSSLRASTRVQFQARKGPLFLASFCFGIDCRGRQDEECLLACVKKPKRASKN